MTLTSHIDSETLGKGERTHRIHFRADIFPLSREFYFECVCWDAEGRDIAYAELPAADKAQIIELCRYRWERSEIRIAARENDRFWKALRERWGVAV